MISRPNIKLRRLVIALLIPLLVGAIGGTVTAPAIPAWYQSLYKPSFAPPNWLFGPVWTILYLLMGISLYMLWQGRGGDERRQALIFFSIQLVANLLWSLLFFGFKSPVLAFIDILILDLTIYLTIKTSHNVSKTSAYALIPYLCWTSFATFLNYAIIILN